MVSALERQREENVRRNRELLLQLGLDALIVPAAPAPKLQANKKPAPRKRAASKRGISEVHDDSCDDAASPSSKGVAVAAAADSQNSIRRSSRHAGKPRVSYTGGIAALTDGPAPSSSRPVKRAKHEGDVEDMDVEKEGRAEFVGNRLGSRVHDPKTYGSIPGVEIGSWWESRAQCSTDAIHAPFVAGICAGPQGAYSIALSGGYEDDVDLGYAFTYTGSGGRDLKGTAGNRKNLRTAPQSLHQSWDNVFNAAMKKSVETKKPVRVIRGFKLQSEWAPATGYRYDGLYRVEKAWMERGLNPGGFQVCKFALKRMDGQPALPRREIGTAAAAQASDDEDGPEEEDGDPDEQRSEKMDVDASTTTRESSVGDGAMDTKATTPAEDVSLGGCEDDARTASAEPADQMAGATSESTDDNLAASTAPNDNGDSAGSSAVLAPQTMPVDGQTGSPRASLCEDDIDKPAVPIQATPPAHDIEPAAAKPTEASTHASGAPIEQSAITPTKASELAAADVDAQAPSSATVASLAQSGALPTPLANAAENPSTSIIPVILGGEEFPLSSVRDERA
ncbi:hypothetical protein AURDEDRAFT_183834 [Auricularia subglabra TFB-10046 SS5]|nr:hypothetical protein AURDEDRAFT_183834 [Auricularia subglabra TFB-10046 SS5]